jgi:hypothetical protein
MMKNLNVNSAGVWMLNADENLVMVSAGTGGVLAWGHNVPRRHSDD